MFFCLKKGIVFAYAFSAVPFSKGDETACCRAGDDCRFAFSDRLPFNANISAPVIPKNNDKNKRQLHKRERKAVPSRKVHCHQKRKQQTLHRAKPVGREICCNKKGSSFSKPFPFFYYLLLNRGDT